MVVDKEADPPRGGADGTLEGALSPRATPSGGKFGDTMVSSYSQSFARYGVSPEALGWTKGRQDLRFQALSRVLTPNCSVLDFGCGFGDFHQFLLDKSFPHSYRGVDVVPEFVDSASRRFPGLAVDLVSFGGRILGDFDYVIASGVFNFLYTEDWSRHQELVFSILQELFRVSRKGIAVDFASPVVDFLAKDSYHQSLDALVEFVAVNLSRKFSIDHSYLPFEFSILIDRDPR